jgi:mitofilin
VPEPEVILPLVAPAISSLDVQEPIITHLAGTIDNLASFLKSNPSAASQAADVLDSAKGDLAALVERMEKVKEEERVALAAKLDEATVEHNLRLLELEMAAQDKLDSQEEGFRKFFEGERQKFLDHYRAKLENELKTQTELINERYAFLDFQALSLC